MNDRVCPECGERHPFYGCCIACEREHCDCWGDVQRMKLSAEQQPGLSGQVPTEEPQ